MALLIIRPSLVDIFSLFCFCLKVSNFVEEDVPVQIIHEEPETNDEGYFYEDIPEDEGFVSEGPWTTSPDEYSSITPVTAVDSGDVCHVMSGLLEHVTRHKYNYDSQHETDWQIV